MQGATKSRLFSYLRIMKKTILTIALSALIPWVAGAQVVNYPDNYKDLFEKADATIKPDAFNAPLIAICGNNPSKAAEVAKAGGVPVFIDSSIEDYNLLRLTACNVDGMVLDSAAQKNVMLLRAVTECNIPIIGKSEILDELNLYIRHKPQNITTVEALVAKAAVYKQAKELMDRIVIADTHCDQPENMVDDSLSIGQYCRHQVSIQKMQEGHGNLVFLACYVGQRGGLDQKGCDRAHRIVTDMLKMSTDDVNSFPQTCGLASSVKEAKELIRDGKKVFMLAVENGYGIGEDLSRIKEYKDLGVTYITLCHMGDNLICGTSSPNSKNGNKGLSEFGIKAVKEMNRLGIMIDLSHTSDATFYDAIKYSSKPVILTHSGVSAVHKHERSISDDMLKALAANGGVLQQYMVAYFMRPDGENGCLDDYMNQLEHAIKVAGIDHVGIGMDFDGGGGGWDINGANDYVNVTVRLLEDGFSPADIEKLWGGNIMRVLEEVQI